MLLRNQLAPDSRDILLPLPDLSQSEHPGLARLEALAVSREPDVVAPEVPSIDVEEPAVLHAPREGQPAPLARKRVSNPNFAIQQSARLAQFKPAGRVGDGLLPRLVEPDSRPVRLL